LGWERDPYCCNQKSEKKKSRPGKKKKNVFNRAPRKGNKRRGRKEKGG